MVADKAPARPYRPVSWEIIVTMPIPIMDSGILPSRPAVEKPLEPGAANRARYGLGTGVSVGSARPLPVTVGGPNFGKA